MDAPKERQDDEKDTNLKERETIDQAFLTMEMLYKSRCVRPPLGSNVTIREIDKDE